MKNGKPKVKAVSGVKCQCDCDWAYIGYAAKIRKLGMNKPVAKYKVTSTKTVIKDKLPLGRGAT